MDGRGLLVVVYKWANQFIWKWI